MSSVDLAAVRRLGLDPDDPAVIEDLERLSRKNTAQQNERPHFFARGAYTFGYVTAVVLPIVGFLVGLALIARPDEDEGRDGAWIIAVSLVMNALAVLIVVATHKS